MKKGSTVTRTKERIIISPELLPQAAKKGTHEANSRRLQIAGENTSFTAGYLYEAVFGGTAIRPSERYPDEANGSFASSSRFRPDHILETQKGTVTTEVKMTSLKSSQPFCYNGQFFNYYRDFLNRLKSGEELPGFNYAFFMYGTREGLKIGRFTNNNPFIENKIIKIRILFIFIILHSPTNYSI
ncbi:MAG: hypothetical protein ABIG69_18970 [Bacteroidota bacterium]